MTTEKNKVNIYVKAHDQASKQLKGISGALSRIPTPIKQIAIGYLSWQGATKILKGTIGAAIKQEEIFNRLRNAVRITGQSYEDAEPRITAFLNRMQETTRYGDTDMAPVLKDLTVLTGKFGDATMDASEIVADMAASGLFNLETATRYVGMAMGGNVEMLGRYIPEMKASAGLIDQNMTASEKWAIAQDVLRKKFGGMAAGELKTFAGRMDQLKNYMGDFGEAIGDIVLPALTAIVKSLVPVAKALTEFINFFSADERKKIEDYSGAVNSLADAYDAAGQQIAEYVLIRGKADQMLDLPKLEYANALDAFNNYVKDLQSGAVDATGIVVAMTAQILEDSADYADDYWAAIFGEDIQKKAFESYSIRFSKAEDAKLKLVELTAERLKEIEDERIAYRTEAVEIELMTEDELQDYITNKRRETMIKSKKYTVDDVANFVKAQNRKKKVQEMLEAAIRNGLNVLADELIETWDLTRIEFGKVFKQIAADFGKMVLEEITRLIAKAVAKWVVMMLIFDKRENDLMAIKSGADFARFFIEGAANTFNQADFVNMIPGMAGGPGSLSMPAQGSIGGRSIVVNVNVETMIGTQDFIDQVIVPGVERAIRREESDIVIVD